jgi:hypothetical protein
MHRPDCPVRPDQRDDTLSQFAGELVERLAARA